MENIKEFFSGIRWDYVIITSFFILMLAVSLAELNIGSWWRRFWGSK